MLENGKEDLTEQPVPFFAKFLEGQNHEDLSDEELELVSGGKTRNIQTTAYPSDQEGVGKPPLNNHLIQTKKFPSDQEVIK